MTRPVVGAQLYTVREHTKTIPEIAETFRKVADIGYTAVQISAFGPVDPKDLAGVIKDSGLKVEYLLVEQDDCYGRDPFESLAISYRNLKSMGYS